MQYSIPAAPTFASLGGTSGAPLTGTLGILANSQQQQPQQQQQQQQPQQLQQQQQQQPHQQTQTSSQGLSAAIPPNAYLMQAHQLTGLNSAQPQHHQHEPTTKKSSRKEDANFGLVLPLHKVKKLIKSESSVKAISGEASFGIARATELLIEQLVQRAYEKMVADKQQSLEYDDIAFAVNRWPATDFLRDIVPERMSLEELIALVERQDEAAKLAASKD